MKKITKIVLNPAFHAGELDRRLFSTFLEPIGDWVYGGMWNPDHETANQLGFRQDVDNLVRELEIPGVRLPGGNFVSGWEWKDSIGPREERKAHTELAWRQIEKNEVGHDEYLEWAKNVGAEPFYTLNLGTGSIQDAIHCVEYTRLPGGTWWSDLRKKNGYEKPHQVKLWYLGNEMDAPWQISTYEKDPKGYGIKACETSRVIKSIDPGSETVVCGTSTPCNRTYPDWDVEVLKQCYDSVDYVSLHYYNIVPEGDLANFFAGSRMLEDFLNTEIGVCDYVKASLHSTRKMMISFDEYGSGFGRQQTVTVGRAGVIDRHVYDEFSTHLERPFIEHRRDVPVNRMGVTMLFALNDASMLMVLMRHADRVKVACSAQGMMTVAMTDKTALKQVGYYSYQMMIRYARGLALLPSVEGPGFDSDAFNLSDYYQRVAFENTPYIETAATLEKETGALNIFIVNRCWEEDLPVELDVSAFSEYELVDHTELYADDYAYNTPEAPYAVVPKNNVKTFLKGGVIYANLKKLSFNMIRLKKM